MRRLLLALLLLVGLSACAYPSSRDMPGYVVLLTPGAPVTPGRCTGALVDPTHVLTALHCVETAMRVTTVTGQEGLIVGAVESTTDDIAVLEVDRAMYAPTYAEFGEAQRNVLAMVVGNCPYFIVHHPRLAYYSGLIEVQTDITEFSFLDQWYMARATGDEGAVCGGDSGGIVLQYGKVVGVLSAVESPIPFWPMGIVFYTVPTGAATGLLQ